MQPGAVTLPRETFDAGMFMAATAHDVPLTPERVALYWEHLRDLDAERFTAAIGACLRSSKWFPKIAEIREEATRRAYVDIHGVPLPAFRTVDAWRDDQAIVRPRRTVGGLVWPDNYRHEGYNGRYMSGDRLVRELVD